MKFKAKTGDAVEVKEAAKVKAEVSERQAFTQRQIVRARESKPFQPFAPWLSSLTLPGSYRNHRHVA